MKGEKFEMTTQMSLFAFCKMVSFDDKTNLFITDLVEGE